MKQLFFATGMLMLFVSIQANAQKNETAFLSKSSIYNSPLLGKSLSAERVVADEAAVSTTAVERFKKEFKDATNVEWKVIANGYRAYFLQDAVLTAVDYNNKGKLYSIIRFGKDVLTKDVVRVFETTFDEPVIIEASEVKIADYATKVYIVVLQDKQSMKTVQVIEGEVEILHEVLK
jgi:hypothetical protein